jgi:hypothetical protein
MLQINNIVKEVTSLSPSHIECDGFSLGKKHKNECPKVKIYI